LYRDADAGDTEGRKYPVDWTLSAVGYVPPRSDNTQLTWFKEQLRRWVIVQVIPPMMLRESEREEPQPFLHLENYISWYRYLSQDQGTAFQLMSELKEILPGFDYFRFDPYGEKHRLLTVFFKNEGNQVSAGYRFDELSDGQRMLIALYSLLSTASDEEGYKYTLCLDEPENFVALPEIQPWLTALYDRCVDGKMQALLISHHPELIDYLLASPVGYWFERQSNRPTRVRPITGDGKEGLFVSELIARGWPNG
jgi:predicted ATPase